MAMQTWMTSDPRQRRDWKYALTFLSVLIFVAVGGMEAWVVLLAASCDAAPDDCALILTDEECVYDCNATCYNASYAEVECPPPI